LFKKLAQVAFFPVFLAAGSVVNKCRWFQLVVFLRVADDAVTLIF
jgi:hypothetical protein